MFDVRKSAMKATTLGELMEGREKGETEELIEMGTVTIKGCEQIELINDKGQPEEQWIFIVEEMPEKFFFAGTVAKNMFKRMLQDCQGDLDELYDGVSQQTIPVEFSEGKTRDNKKVTKIRVL